MFSILNRFLFGTRSDRDQTLEAVSSIKNSLQLVPAGDFLMGSDHGGDDEFPIHNVMLDAFLLMRTPVTQGQWRLVMGDEPWKKKRFVREGDDYPAVSVSYYDALRFINRINQAGTSRFRLPTEAEWEYVARAGLSGPWDAKSWDWVEELKENAWYYDNAFRSGEHYPHVVARKRANPWGFFDMLGNVGEWCSDWYARNYYKRSPLCDPPGPRYGNKKMVRGGDWSKTEYFLRPTCRMYYSPHVRDVFIGFRLIHAAVQERPDV